MTALLLSGGIAFFLAILGTPLLIHWLNVKAIGQPIRNDGPQSHQKKSGTPTMGGLAIVFAVVTAYFVTHSLRRPQVPFSRGGLLVLFALVGAGAVGLSDDWIKVRHKRSLGLNKRAKAGGQIAVALVFAVGAAQWANVRPVIGFTRFDAPGWTVPTLVWVVVAVVWVTGFSNAVNLTDGLDGLAAGSSTFAFGAYVVICFWAFRHPEYQVRQALDLAVVAAALVGACAGFWWWNAAPARIFMGDVGSLAIGSAFGALAMITATPLLLPIIGGVFVVETLSVMIQVFTFRLMGGRRLFRMAPIHHHFELGGWPETTVIIRFWIIAMFCAAVGLGIFYADFIATGGID